MKIKWNSEQIPKMNVKNNKDVTFLTYPAYEEMNWLVHGFSTRFGGVSRGIYSSMNLSFTRGDEENAVKDNYRRLSAAVGFSLEDIVTSDQTHTTNVQLVGAEDRGKGVTRPRTYKDVDGMVCLPLGTITVQEVVPPKGYLLDSTIFVQKLEEKNVMSTHFNSFKYFNVVDKANYLKLVKVQEGTDIPLSNVTFKHFVNGSSYIGQDTTNEKGEIEFVALSSGKHTLQEFKTIDGYVLDASPIEFEVLENGSITGVNSVIKVENKVRPFSLKIQKKNDKNELLNGAVFGLFKDEKCLECVEEKTTQDGVVVFDGLKNKETYYVKEVKAPAGYRMNKQVYCLNTDFVPVNNQFDVYINQEKVNGLYENGTVNMEFINQRMVKLPHTGSAKVLFMSVIGMFLMAKKLKEKE